MKFAASKILAGLRDVLGYAKCRHEFTFWTPNRIPAGCSQTNSWSRICTKCKCRETVFKEPVPNLTEFAEDTP
jgi:hypothetical protein